MEQYGVAVPQGIVAETPEAAAAAACELGGQTVIKAQVLTGGRGKAGGIKMAASPEAAEATARDILSITIKDMPVKKVLVVKAMEISAEFYVSFTIDRRSKAVAFIFSAAGGIDIEEVAATSPEKIKTVQITDPQGPQREQLVESLSDVFDDQERLDEALDIALKMFRLFREKDCSLVEINPLVLTNSKQLVPVDAKIVIDDNAVFRHPDIEALKNAEEYSADELDARQAGLSFVSLDGEIGCMVNGAGLAMATMDNIKLFGGKAANFLDVGGSSDPAKVVDAFTILLRNEKLKVILVNIFGGITRCDDVAKGMLIAREQLNIPVPMVIRLIGTNEKKGHELLKNAGLIVTSGMSEAVRKAVDCLKETPQT